MRMASRLLVLSAWACLAQEATASVVEDYLERYFLTFPTAATAAGRHDLDHQLEDLGVKERDSWLQFNRHIADLAEEALADPDLPFERYLDLELVLREAELQVFRFGTLRIPDLDPLYWTGMLGNATVFLLVRDDLPLAERLESAKVRAELIPRLAAQARSALEASDSNRIAPELCLLAERQARSTATFYRQGFARAAAGEGRQFEMSLENSGVVAAVALTGLADYLGELGQRATGSFLLGDLYAEQFRLVTRVEEPVDRVLAGAQQALVLKVDETAAYGRVIWSRIFPDQPVPAEDTAVIRALFERASEDRAKTTDEFVEDYRTLAEESVEFVRRLELMTLPEPLTLRVGRSPSFFIGQSVGGVYPAGPYASPEAETLLFLPTPSEDASPEQRDAFFRDFNHHFNVMITPHELIPGHYLQLKFAAQQPHKARALFGDGVYIEGWGSFAERLMLDEGWGGPLDRVAHLRKQLENIARTIVDIRVHTQGMQRDEVVNFVKKEALQDDQFAANMWRRAMTSSPQLTFYYLGYREVWGLYEEVKTTRGAEFDLREFMDGMMELGPVSVRHYRQRMLGDR